MSETWTLNPETGRLQLGDRPVQIEMRPHLAYPFRLHVPERPTQDFITLQRAKADGERCAAELAEFGR